MIKRLLLIIVAIAFVSAGYAQVTAIKPNHNIANNSSKMWVGSMDNAPIRMAVQMPKAAKDADKMWWSYPDDNGLLRLYRTGATEYNLAMIIPQGFSKAKIDSVSMFFINADAASNVKVWFSPVTRDDTGKPILPASAEDAEYHFDVNKSDLAFITRLELPSSYTIPDGGCCVGYSFTIEINDDMEDNKNYPLITFDSYNYGNGLFVQDAATGEWQDPYMKGISENLSMSIFADVTGLESHDAIIEDDIRELSCLVNNPVYNYITVANNGFKDITEVSYVATVNGVESAECTTKLSLPARPGETDYIQPIIIPTKEGINDVSVRITKVDGLENTFKNKEAKGTVIAVAQAVDRTHVVEELTSTWNERCPPGHVGMAKLKEDFGNKIITLSGHMSGLANNTYIDPMECDDYRNAIITMGAYAPSAEFNRSTRGDSYFGIVRYISNNKYIYGADKGVYSADEWYPSVATVAMDAKWADYDKTKIAVNTYTNFAFNRDDAPYGIAFVMSEDGMTGTGDEWLQYNFLSAEYADLYYQQYGKEYMAADWYNDDMKDWINAPMWVEMAYNNVVVAAWDAVVGADNSMASPIRKGEMQNYNTTLDISEKSLIQDKSKLKLAALLINKNNGVIENAAQVSLGESSGIDGVTTDSKLTEVARYNANGMRLDSPQKGLNIVKMSNGKSVKVMVK